MSNLAKKIQQESVQPEKKSVKVMIKTTKSLLSPGEKLLGVTFAVLVCIGGVTIVSNQAEIYQTNKAIQQSQSTISSFEKSNQELENEIEKLSSLERLREVAKRLGLDFSKDNVKVVH